MPTYAPNARTVQTMDSTRVTQYLINAAIRPIHRKPQPFIDDLQFIRWLGADFILPDGYQGKEYKYAWEFVYPETMELYSGTLPPGIAIETVSTVRGRLFGTPETFIVPGTTYDFQLAVRAGDFVSVADFHITIREGFGGGGPPGGGGEGGGGAAEPRPDVRGTSKADMLVANQPGVDVSSRETVKIMYRDQDITDLVNRARAASSRQENMLIVGPGVSKTKDGNFMISS